MELNLQYLDTGTLDKVYQWELEALHARLLSGASWRETEEQRRYVTQLSIALANRSDSRAGHPTESRRDNGPDGKSAP